MRQMKLQSDPAVALADVEIKREERQVYAGGRWAPSGPGLPTTTPFCGPEAEGHGEPQGAAGGPGTPRYLGHLGSSWHFLCILVIS